MCLVMCVMDMVTISGGRVVFYGCLSGANIGRVVISVLRPDDRT